MKKNSYNHGASNKANESCMDGYSKPKPIGAMVHKPKPDMSTPSFGKGHANQGGKKK